MYELVQPRLNAAERLAAMIEVRTARVGILGLGYVGLPTAVEFARVGFPVTGFEVDPERAEAVNGGRSPVCDVPDELLSSLVRAGRLRATVEDGGMRDCDALIICVPTPLTSARQPDLSYVHRAVDSIARSLRPGQLVILESTTYPGTTEEVVVPRLAETGLALGGEVFVAFAPERLDPGNPSHFRNIPKVVGGHTPACTRLACQLYGHVVERTVPVSSPTVAEMVKCYENVFRNVNIALVNELALLCDRMELDVWEIIDAASTKPYGFMPFYPGPGVGGHCIPVDPYYLAAKAREYDFHVKFIEVAAQVNDSMPYYTCSKVVGALGRQGKSVHGARVLVLGATYKPDVPDVRESPALKVMALLRKRGAEVSFHDPYVREVTLPNPGTRLRSVDLTEEILRSADCVVVATNHRCYDYAWIANGARLVVDTRNALRGVRNGNVVAL
jgi:UDP-N-acetyl-D-glucosamine dehydrogenase